MSLTSIKENAFGFRTKILYFIERIEKLRAEKSKAKADIKILDFGCGNGALVTLPLGEEGYNVVGIDLHEESIEQAKKHNNFPNVKFLHGEFANLKKEFGKFDVVVLSDVLEHLGHPESLLKEIKSILNEGGIVLISIPNGYGPFEIENFILRKTGLLKLRRFLQRSKQNLQTMNDENGHVQFFTTQSFKHLIENSGFEINDSKNGALLCGPISGRLINLLKPLVSLNLLAGKTFPSSMCSVWYFEVKYKV